MGKAVLLHLSDSTVGNLPGSFGMCVECMSLRRVLRMKLTVRPSRLIGTSIGGLSGKHPLIAMWSGAHLLVKRPRLVFAWSPIQGPQVDVPQHRPSSLDLHIKYRQVDEVSSSPSTPQRDDHQRDTLLARRVIKRCVTPGIFSTVAGMMGVKIDRLSLPLRLIKQRWSLFKNVTVVTRFAHTLRSLLCSVSLFENLI